MATDLDGARIALLIAPAGTEEPEFVDPKTALAAAGAQVTVIGIETGEVQAVNGDLEPGGTYTVDLAVADVDPADFDALVIPGGTVGADKLRADGDVISLVRTFAGGEHQVLAAICHAPWTLVEADVVGGRQVTSYPSLATDLRNAGATWVDEEVVVDDRLITSRNPGDLPAFSDAIIEAVATARAER
jgi:protease I